MVFDMGAIVSRLKTAGATNVRAVPMQGAHAVSGKYQIEVRNDGTWSVLAENMTKDVSDRIIREATNRVICG